MKTLTKLIIIPCLLTVLIFSAFIELKASSGKTVYYFWAQNCSACKDAQTFYKKPDNIKDGSSWVYNGTKFISYRIVDENNKIISKHMNLLNGMCTAITKKTGTANIVYFRRDIYEFYINKNLPYLRKEEKYSRKDEPFPTPIFITGNRVVLGFNQDLIQKAIDSAQ